MQISATDKDITPRNVKFKFSLGTEDSNFTLMDNHGEQQSSQPGSEPGRGWGDLSLETPGSRNKSMNWGHALTSVFTLQNILYNSHHMILLVCSGQSQSGQTAKCTESAIPHKTLRQLDIRNRCGVQTVVSVHELATEFLPA